MCALCVFVSVVSMARFSHPDHPQHLFIFTLAAAQFKRARLNTHVMRPVGSESQRGLPRDATGHCSGAASADGSSTMRLPPAESWGPERPGEGSVVKKKASDDSSGRPYASLICDCVGQGLEVSDGGGGEAAASWVGGQSAAAAAAKWHQITAGSAAHKLLLPATRTRQG